MRWMGSICLVLGLVLAGGCAGQKQPPPPPAATGKEPGAAVPRPEVPPPVTPIVTPSPVAQGKVALANAQARYVIVRFPVGAVPVAGQRMNVYRSGLKVGVITITGPQRDFNIAADMVEGECQVGDEVREN